MNNITSETLAVQDNLNIPAYTCDLCVIWVFLIIFLRHAAFAQFAKQSTCKKILATFAIICILDYSDGLGKFYLTRANEV